MVAKGRRGPRYVSDRSTSDELDDVDDEDAQEVDLEALSLY